MPTIRIMIRLTLVFVIFLIAQLFEIIDYAIIHQLHFKIEKLFSKFSLLSILAFNSVNFINHHILTTGLIWIIIGLVTRRFYSQISKIHNWILVLIIAILFLLTLHLLLELSFFSVHQVSFWKKKKKTGTFWDF